MIMSTAEKTPADRRIAAALSVASDRRIVETSEIRGIDNKTVATVRRQLQRAGEIARVFRPTFARYSAVLELGSALPTF
jgi:hypothetical protein